MSDNDSELGSFLAGFVVGGLLGAAVALILAPQSGAETRSQISGKGHEMQAAGERTVQQVVDTADLYAHQVSERASEFGHEVEQQARIVLDAGRQGVSSRPSNGSPDVTGNEDEDAESSTST